jgi:SAM-dependent methyltransferase
MSPFQPGRGVITEISPRDKMLGGDDDSGSLEERRNHYFWLGHSAMHRIRTAIRAAARGPGGIESILDLPCGHGRVMRSLKASFPDAALTACDIDRDGVDFCARVFGATPVYGAVDPTEVEFDRSFDLIWCGSLLTHLEPETQWPDFLALFERSLGDRGLLVFTSNGRAAAQMMRDGTYDHGLDPGQIEVVLEQFGRSGAGYTSYAGYDDYGISVAMPSRVARVIEQHTALRLVGYTEAGWGDHQDVVACVPTG